METDLVFLGKWTLSLKLGPFNESLGPLFVYKIGDEVILQHAKSLGYCTEGYNVVSFKATDISRAIRLTLKDDGRKVSFRYYMGGVEEYFVFLEGNGYLLIQNPNRQTHGDFDRTINTPGLKEIKQSKNAAGYDLSHVQLKGADLSEVNLTGANFSDAKLDRAVLKGATLTSAQMPGLDLSTVVTDDKTTSAGTQQKATNLSGAKVPYGLINRNWQWIDLSNAEIIGLPQELSSQQKPLLAKGARLAGLKNDFTELHLEHADFSEADMTGLNLEGAHLTKAKFVGTLLNDANLSNATLTEADMSGAQLGSIALMFNVTGANSVNAFKTALDKDNVQEVTGIFKANGVTLTSPVSIEASQGAAGRVWTVRDSQVKYIARLDKAGGQELFGVYKPSSSAVLDSAFMKGVILTSANLYGVIAASVQLYGGAKLDNAILENADFTLANLGNVNFTQAKLLGTTLTNAILTNAIFTGAYLTPSDINKKASLDGANLQGANFSDAHLDDAIFINAAVSVANETNPKHADGVWLFKANEQESKLYIPELKGATKRFTLPEGSLKDLVEGPVNNNLKVAFNSKGAKLSDDATISVQKSEDYWLIADGDTSYTITRGCDQRISTPALIVQSSHSNTKPFAIPLALEKDLKSSSHDDLRKAFAEKGKVTLSEKAPITTKQRAIAWNIKSTPTQYTVWLGLDISCKMTLSVAPSIPNVRQWFKDAGFELGWQTAVTGKGNIWMVDNGSDDPFEASVGYIKFNLVPSTNDGPINVYGFMMRLKRLVESNQLEYHNIVCEITHLKDALLPTTYCPNGQQVQHERQLPFREWMHASKPPKPPHCVPSADGSYYCPKATKAKRDK